MLLYIFLICYTCLDAHDTWASAKENRSVFHWASGSELPQSSSLWIPLQPSFGEGCVEMSRGNSYYLNDCPCYFNRQVICELQP